MRTYGSIPTDFWRKHLPQKIRGNGTAMAMACYLMSSPHSNIIGIYNLPIGYIHVDTAIEENQIRESLALLEEARWAFYDDEMIYIPCFAELQVGLQVKVNDGRFRAIVNEWQKCPHIRFKEMFFQRYSQDYHLVPSDWG